MKSIIYVGMDVHSTNYTLASYAFGNEQPFAVTQVDPDYKHILKYLKQVQKNYGGPCEFLCGYEAGCLGFTLYEQLKAHNVPCVILAPSKIPKVKNEIKTDKRDAIKIAKCLAYNDYSAVYVPTKEDHQVKEYIRMRDAHKAALKKLKQQILAFCLRKGWANAEVDVITSPFYPNVYRIKGKQVSRDEALASLKNWVFRDRREI